MKHLLRHLISDEVGVSAALATALDPEIDGNAPMRAVLCSGLASLIGLPLSDCGPSAVYVEYPRNGDATADILLVWDEWAVFIENKIKAASVRKGQLEREYTQFRNYMGSFPELKPLKHIAIVLLSPGNAGASHIERLEVAESDHKAKLNWSDVLAQVRQFRVDSAPMSLFEAFQAKSLDYISASVGTSTHLGRPRRSGSSRPSLSMIAR